jgi:phosphonate transport system substrate-binding protein
MKRAFRSVLPCLFALLLVHEAAFAEVKTLRIGVLPTLSPRLLLKNYEYVRMYLARELQQRMELGTGTSFTDFHRQVMADEYDVILTGAHLARLAQREKGWIPLATYKTPNRAILLVGNDSPIHGVEDLRGKTVTSADPLALVGMQGRQWLLENGLKPSRDYRFIDSPSFTSAAHAVAQQQAALAIISPSSYKQLPESLKHDTRVLQTLPELPAVMWLVHPKSGVDPARLKRLLLAFTADSAEGKAFFEATGYQGMREVAAEQMQALDVYADETKALLDSKR